MPSLPVYSNDGQWVWDGRDWLPIVSPDGSWRWNGTKWIPNVSTGLPGQTSRRGATLNLWGGSALATLVIMLVAVLIVARATSVSAGWMVGLSVSAVIAAGIAAVLAVRVHPTLAWTVPPTWLIAVVLIAVIAMVSSTHVPSMEEQNRVDVNQLTIPAPAESVAAGTTTKVEDLTVLSSSTGRLSSVDIHGNVLGSVAVGRDPVGWAGSHMDEWIANSGDGTVTRVNMDKWQVVSTISVGGRPVSLAVEGQVFVADQEGRSIAEIDPNTDRVVQRINLAHPPSMLISLLGQPGTLVVASTADGTVSCVDPSNRRGTVTVSVPGHPSRMLAVTDYTTQSVSPINLVAVLSPDERVVTLVNPDKCVITSSVAVGDQPISIISDITDFYVLSRGSGTVTEFRHLDPSHPQTIQVGAHATAFTVERSSGMWVGYDDGTVVRLGIQTVPKEIFSIGFPPKMMEASLNSVWVVSGDTRAVEFGLHYFVM
jgi:hypothetical protein